MQYAATIPMTVLEFQYQSALYRTATDAPVLVLRLPSWRLPVRVFIVAGPTPHHRNTELRKLANAVDRKAAGVVLTAKMLAGSAK